MSFDADAVADEVLSAAAEDWLGLYEVVWCLNTLQPMATVTEKYAAAEEAVRSLLRSGSVSLYRLPWQEPSTVADLVETAEVEAVLANPQSWSPSLGTDPPTYIGLATTEEGERELARRAVGGPKQGE
ncbi:MAG: hypothetical protein ABJF88_13635 [Rhodothermales bacterium]